MKFLYVDLSELPLDGVFDAASKDKPKKIDENLSFSDQIEEVNEWINHGSAKAVIIGEVLPSSKASRHYRSAEFIRGLSTTNRPPIICITSAPTEVHSDLLTAQADVVISPTTPTNGAAYFVDPKYVRLQAERLNKLRNISVLQIEDGAEQQHLENINRFDQLGISLDQTTKKARLFDKPLELCIKDYLLLETLVKEISGSHETLKSNAKFTTGNQSRSYNHHILNLRKAIHESLADQKFDPIHEVITTRPGFGYELNIGNLEKLKAQYDSMRARSGGPAKRRSADQPFLCPILPKSTLTFLDLKVDATGQIFHNEKLTHLTDTSRNMLITFITAAQDTFCTTEYGQEGRPVDRKELSKNLGRNVDDKSVSTYVSNMRKEMDKECPDSEAVLITLKGDGWEKGSGWKLVSREVTDVKKKTILPSVITELSVPESYFMGFTWKDEKTDVYFDGNALGFLPKQRPVVIELLKAEGGYVSVPHLSGILYPFRDADEDKTAHVQKHISDARKILSTNFGHDIIKNKKGGLYRLMVEVIYPQQIHGPSRTRAEFLAMMKASKGPLN